MNQRWALALIFLFICETPAGKRFNHRYRIIIFTLIGFVLVVAGVKLFKIRFNKLFEAKLLFAFFFHYLFYDRSEYPNFFIGLAQQFEELWHSVLFVHSWLVFYGFRPIAKPERTQSFLLIYESRGDIYY